MENAEEILHTLEEFSKVNPKDIPRELDDYLGYVARTGDPVFKWSIIKCLYREKLTSVITDFHEASLSIEVQPCPNVDPFNYERMKANLLEKLESFNGAPFTVQRLSELLTNPRKEYNRADKFMRAVEKNILVVSTIEPGRGSENDLVDDPSFNGVPEPEALAAASTGFDAGTNARLPETESTNVPFETIQERHSNVADERQSFSGEKVSQEPTKAVEQVDVCKAVVAAEGKSQAETTRATDVEEEDERFLWVKSLRPSTATETAEKSRPETANSSGAASTSSTGQETAALSSSDALLLDPLLHLLPVSGRWTDEEKMLALNQMGTSEVEPLVTNNESDSRGDRKEFDSFLMSSNAPSSSYEECIEVEGVESKRRRCEQVNSELVEPPSQIPEVTDSAEVVNPVVTEPAETIENVEPVGSSGEIATTEPPSQVYLPEIAEPSSDAQSKDLAAPHVPVDGKSSTTMSKVECDTSETTGIPSAPETPNIERDCGVSSAAEERIQPISEIWDGMNWQSDPGVDEKAEDKQSPKVQDETPNSDVASADENVVSSCQDEVLNCSKEKTNNGCVNAEKTLSTDESPETSVIHKTWTEAEEPMDVGECQTTSAEHTWSSTSNKSIDGSSETEPC